jgi:hypothetical protein
MPVGRPRSGGIQKGIRFPDDLRADVENYMAWLVENGFMSYPNFSETVLFLLRRAQKLGQLKTPPDWYTQLAESEKAKKGKG